MPELFGGGGGAGAAVVGWGVGGWGGCRCSYSAFSIMAGVILTVW